MQIQPKDSVFRVEFKWPFTQLLLHLATLEQCMKNETIQKRAPECVSMETETF